jgi:hypothetical protein
MAAQRIDAGHARADVESGSALLVCAYDTAPKCAENFVPGAISLADFRAQENALRKDRVIIFYCA